MEIKFCFNLLNVVIFRPVQSSQIRTNYRSEFSHALEPWVGKSVITAAQQQQQAGGEMGPQVPGEMLWNVVKSIMEKHIFQNEN